MASLVQILILALSALDVFAEIKSFGNSRFRSHDVSTSW
jgi:hypothetical protein